MKVERRSGKNRSERPWFPRPPMLFPAPKVIKSKKAYDRKRDKRSNNYLSEETS